MAKDYLDLSYGETKKFKTPKVIYYIEADRGGCTIHHYNCYAIHKRKKDFLVRRKVNVWNVATPKDATQFRWRKFDRHLITFDLNYAKKIAVLEAEKSKTKRIGRVQEDVNKLEISIRKKKNLQNEIKDKVWTEEDIRENDANKDETYMSL